MKTMLIEKSKTESGFSYKTNAQVRNDKRDFKFALLQVCMDGRFYILKLANDTKQCVDFVNRWWYKHTIAVNIETGEIIFEKVRTDD